MGISTLLFGLFISRIVLFVNYFIGFTGLTILGIIGWILLPYTTLFYLLAVAYNSNPIIIAFVLFIEFIFDLGQMEHKLKD